MSVVRFVCCWQRTEYLPIKYRQDTLRNACASDDFLSHLHHKGQVSEGSGAIFFWSKVLPSDSLVNGILCIQFVEGFFHRKDAYVWHLLAKQMGSTFGKKFEILKKCGKLEAKKNPKYRSLGWERTVGVSIIAVPIKKGSYGWSYQ